MEVDESHGQGGGEAFRHEPNRNQESLDTVIETSDVAARNGSNTPGTETFFNEKLAGKRNIEALTLGSGTFKKDLREGQLIADVVHPNCEEAVKDDEDGGQGKDNSRSFGFANSFVFPIGSSSDDKIPNFAWVGGEGVEERREAKRIRGEKDQETFNT